MKRNREAVAAARFFVAVVLWAGLVTGCGDPTDLAVADGAGNVADSPTVGVPEEPQSTTPLPSGTNGGPVPGPGSTGSGRPNEEEIIAALMARDSDHDGRSDFDELEMGTDPNDPQDGPDIDGDGIPNGEDPDVDGDGLDNGSDRDIDGDGLVNGVDDDVDGDGLLADEDDDDDGDGIPDDEDQDDDGDGEPDCDCENGACSRDGTFCLCDSGWEGDSCDEFHCRDVRNCSNGTCVGPNECQCFPGWETHGADPCTAFHCDDVGNCNGHGQCTGPNVCECEDEWKGKPNCTQPTCVLSPSTCDDNDPCTVDECDPSSGCSNDPLICPLFETCIRGTCTTGCTNASGCPFGQGCRDSGCFDCSQDSECADGDSCTNDVCDLEQGCTHETVTCPEREVCVFGRCRNECSREEDCALTESCQGGACVTICADEQDCELDEICDDNGRCVPADVEDGE